jgi:methionyl-tRNA synthetase
MGNVLRVLVDVLRAIGTVLLPFMPTSMSRLLDQLGVPSNARDFAALILPLPDGTVVPAPQGIFPRIVETAA